MTTELVTASPGDSVAAVRNLMYRHWVRHIPVVDAEGRLAGLVTYRDLLRRSLIERSDRPVWVEQEELEHIEADTVSQHIVDEVAPETLLKEAGKLLLESRKGCLAVVEDDRLVGMLSEADFVRFVVEQLGSTPEPDSPEEAADSQGDGPEGVSADGPE